jgi:methionyl-tRNA formyltransferase
VIIDPKRPGKILRVVFMGTPEFAVTTLGALLMNGYDVAAVVTSPDKPAGRGQQIVRSSVKSFSESDCLPVLQPASLKDPGFIKQLKDLNADIFVVVAFRMIPEAVWRIPPMGTINLHASLLPQYRGPAPINHVIINGETMTGLTTFLINDKIDTGNILMRKEVPVFPLENAGDLHDKLMVQGARLVVMTLAGLAEGSLKPRSQEEFMKTGEILKPAPKIFPENCIINWHGSPENIHNLVRGLSPYPCAKSEFRNNATSISYKLFESHPEFSDHNLEPGKVLSDGKNYIKIACKNGFINILNLQLESKKRMYVQEFLRGFRISEFT